MNEFLVSQVDYFVPPKNNLIGIWHDTSFKQDGPLIG